MRLLDEQDTRTPFYGIRRMAGWLRQQGYAVNPKRVARLLRTRGLETIYPKPRLSQPHPEHRLSPSLLRDVPMTRVNQVWSTDITSIRLQAGFVSWVAVMDWFSRDVLSWAVSMTMDVGVCLEA
jgi:putative transposase